MDSGYCHCAISVDDDDGAHCTLCIKYEMAHGYRISKLIYYYAIYPRLKFIMLFEML